jgi:hypothetical protein
MSRTGPGPDRGTVPAASPTGINSVLKRAEGCRLDERFCLAPGEIVDLGTPAVSWHRLGRDWVMGFHPRPRLAVGWTFHDLELAGQMARWAGTMCVSAVLGVVGGRGADEVPSTR